MRKADIVRRIADATDLSQGKAEEGVDAISTGPNRSSCRWFIWPTAFSRDMLNRGSHRNVVRRHVRE